ncbi:MAG TPA: organomercurial lyase, partial [bacterium]|nr:organomercurial lyase [bacterium]
MLDPRVFAIISVTVAAVTIWCALDTLIYPSLLGVEAEVVSPCHASGTPVR